MNRGGLNTSNASFMHQNTFLASTPQLLSPKTIQTQKSSPPRQIIFPVEGQDIEEKPKQFKKPSNIGIATAPRQKVHLVLDIDDD